uniref:Uncharacterized protein n=1 Tax=Arundo donax TaxID=35708 RepID=A0A0A9B8R1_ARUDO
MLWELLCAAKESLHVASSQINFGHE